MFKDENLIPITQNSVDATLEKITSSIKIHDELIEIVEKINECYSLQMVFYFASNFLILLMFLFNSWTFANYFNTDGILYLLITLLIYHLYYLSFLLLVMYFGSSATKQGQKTSKYVHKALNMNLHKKIDSKVNC